MTSVSIGSTACFHCGEPVPPGAGYSVVWQNTEQPLCCRGCEAVAQAILKNGLGDYYRHRTTPAGTGREALPSVLHALRVYDHPAIQHSFVRGSTDRREAALILENIRCAACVWLNEQHLRQLPGVWSVEVNYSTRRAHVAWDDRRIHLSDLLAAIEAIGYHAHPYDPTRSQQLAERERRTLLKQLGLAAVLGGQVMTISVALYLGDWEGTDPALRNFFQWVNLLLTLPVLAYSAQPFFVGAWQDLTHRRAGMDVPIVLGLCVAFVASVAVTLSGQGTSYYDSVTMFVFFLLAGRYMELNARQRANQAGESLVQAVPRLATRLTQGDMPEEIAVAELRPGDRVRVRPGEPIPADGRIVEGRSSVNEALLTGESLPAIKQPGATVIGGSLNVESPLTLVVERVGPDTVLSAVMRLLDRAQSSKPRLAQLADRVAAWFVSAVLLLTAAVGLYWWAHAPDRALPIVIAVLVVTCPCALGLATPTALAAATGALTRGGLLTTRGHALETLARATHFVFDKTGTLTRGELRLTRQQALADVSIAECLALVRALEAHSEHPIARAFLGAEAETARAVVTEVRNTPGEGLSGRTASGVTVWAGTPAFVARWAGLAGISTDTGLAPAYETLSSTGNTRVLLAQPGKLLAVFELEDALRAGAAELIEQLTAQGRTVWLLTGDHAGAAQRVADALGIHHVAANLKPADKLEHLRALQREGAVVAMIGDGVNDAPVLAGAQVSVAMGHASHLSADAADMLLLSGSLAPLGLAVCAARRTMTIIRQNLAWAVAYNLLAVPAAAAGLITPWMAALGMSLSSLIVVANALRLLSHPVRA